MTKPVGEYVYHASNLPDQSAGLKSILTKGLQPSEEGYAGPGLYFAYEPDGGYYHVSEEEATLFRVKWADLVAKFGTYPDNENGIQRDEDEIIVPGAVPADLLEVEYFPGEWWDLTSAYRASLGPVNEVAIDNKQGAGAVPYNADVDYFGLRVAMKPSVFLDLAAPLHEKDNSEMENYIRGGGAIGAPFLDIVIPPEWDEGDFTKFAKIQGHEGRHRMKAIQAVEGDHPVEVHLFPKYYRARDLTPEFIEHLNSGIYAEKSSRLVRGPLFDRTVTEASLAQMRDFFSQQEPAKPVKKVEPVNKNISKLDTSLIPPHIKMILWKVQNERQITPNEYHTLKTWHDRRKIFGEDEIKVDSKAHAKAWIEKVYAEYPAMWQNNHVMMWGEGDDQQLAMFELIPSMTKKDAVEVKWFQAYPLRQGVGTRAMAELQRLAREDGITLTLFPWQHGQVSQAKLTKFYKQQGFQPTVKGAKNMIWSPEGVAEGLENFNGIDVSLEIQKDDEYVDDEDYDNQVIYVTASSNGRELGHVLFAFDGEYLMPQDLEVDERYQRQGIAATMYDYVKSKGYKIRRSGQQTDAGAGFWNKHKSGKNVWEQGVNEGGWASTATQNTTITPQVVAQSVELLKHFDQAYNAWQEQHELGLAIEIGDPVGSGTYYKRDLANDPEREYGDIDVRCWIDNNGTPMAQRTTQYRDAIREFCRTTQDYATENGNNIIVQTPAGAVQVDLIFTLREHAEWTRALAPEYRVKGVISTSLMSSLAEVLNMSIGLQGVQVKTRAGRPVSFRQSKDTELATVSTNPNNWGGDIYSYYYQLAKNAKPEVPTNLAKHGGLKDEQRLSDIVMTVRALATDMEQAGLLGTGALDYIANAQDMLKRVAKVYSDKLEAGINSSKFDKAATPAAQEKANKTKLMLAKYRNEITKLLLS